MNMHKFLANAVVLAGFIAVPFIPFIILSQTTFFPFIVGKNFAFRVVVEIMFSAWVVLAVIDPAYRPKKSWLLGAFAAFLAIITLAGIFGENPTKSFWSNFERMEGLVTYFHLFAYFIVASTVLTVRDLWRPYLNFHLFAGVIMAIYATMQWAGLVGISQGGHRLDGTLGNTEYLGTYALFNIFIAGFFLVRQSFTTTGERSRVAIYGAIILFQTFIIYNTATRGAILGLIAGLGLTTILIAIFERNNKIVRKSAIGILFAIVIFVVGFIAMRDTAFIRESPVLSRFAAISLTEQTSKSRLMVWNMAYQGFKERPLLGWGMENFNYVFNKYYDPNMWGQEQWFDRAHNVFFDWLVAGGALALLGYLSLFACAIYCIWRRGESFSVLEKSILTGLLGGYFFQNLFVFDNVTSLIYFGTILAYIESFGHKEQVVAKEKKLKVGEEDLTFMVSGGAVVLALVLIYTVNYKGYMQNTTLIRALSERVEEGAMHNLLLMKETIAYNSFGTSEAREQLSSLSINAFGQSKEISPIQNEFILLTKEELAKQANELPNDARYQLFLGSYLVKTGEIDRGITYLNKALELSPAKQSMFFELAMAYSEKKDMVKTEEMLRRAFELAPEFAQAEKYYLQILVQNGKIKEAKKILERYPLPNVAI